MKNKQNITALIITFNEIKHIESVIKNIDFADEIIVVDSFSTDGTFEKLQQLKNVKTIQRKFKNFADQRNYALKQATHEWILFIDADERITEPLKNEILEAINTPKDSVAFMVKRLYFFKQKRIRFSGFQTDTTYRLFKKGTVNYIEDKIVHEMPEIDGESKLFKNTMLHYCFDSSAHYKSKMERYAKLKALELFNKGKKSSPYHLYLRPVIKFVTNYIFRLGILDGKEGFQICYLSAYGVYFRYQELEKLTR
ncbi:glycosyltransferase family 2 protein [Algibacter amylolyticus]|uniref:Glycosyltransferase family 2 protein n=1 Tax=Algibacter amylolyticus TaxID=1608400 RepID=A0A5M7BA42_9FLAO|nr:glycosyltransferase family 2 protein [Algibacter amylolyticus]KAA5824414.1 glycosyltransferase family 2 protein [Algibacter amylolyticus]MBB5269528.1 glycosyltransferase involved in cell wall biosynthesis [Algibacter amylolyticus]TSJ75187.1 glycosyltransferase family 2 protein [Algibacter amylolyticus]